MQHIVLRVGLLSAMNICKISPRHSDFNAIRPGRSLHEELQRRQHQLQPLGSMMSFGGQLPMEQHLKQQKQQKQTTAAATKRLTDEIDRLSQDYKVRLIERTLQDLLRQKDFKQLSRLLDVI
ncbi:hypothetical protein KR093_004569 [Drosophila rubida]|uniref:Uncharacterized protein n=1 Tax=Drosophila rubida TaxID=30044 RepID=A0AAD4PQR2_9MUSC|nr:hypothetical protein KR093_004569 [Drosophila rubida]